MQASFRETTRDILSNRAGYPVNSVLRGLSGLGSISDTPGFWGDLVDPSVYTSDGGDSGFDWGSLLTYGVKNIATPILNSQFGGPQPGQYFAQGPNGQRVAYAVPQGSNSINAFPGLNLTSGGGSLMPILLIGGGLLLAVKLIGK